MATTDEILNAAREVGKLVSEHDTAKRLEGAIKMLQNDVASQRVLTDFNRALQSLGEKEARGQGITLEDKHKLEELQRSVVRNPTLRSFQMAQMDYVDLLRKIDEAITGESGVEPTAGAAPAGSGAAPSGGIGGPVIVGPGLM